MVSREEVASYRGFCTFKSVGCICMKLLCLLQRGVSLRIPWVTGVQALERNYPDLPMLPGHVLRREFEYIRHGTLSWFINWDVVSGQVIEPSWGPTRTEEDALTHLQRLVASDPKATKWHIILDNLNIHQSEALLPWVAEKEGVTSEDLV